MVHGVGGLAGVVAQLRVGLDLGAGGDLLLDPVLEGGLLGDLARGAHAEDERGGVVALGVGEVPEVEGGLDRRVRRRQVQAAPRPRPRDVGRHAERVPVLDVRVPQPQRVERERDLVAVHHDVGDVAVRYARRVRRRLLRPRVGRLAPQEDPRVRVHRRLVLRHGLLQLPHDDALRVVLQVLAHPRDVLHHGDPERRELRLRAETREQHQPRRVDGAGGEDRFRLRLDGARGPVLELHIDAGDGVALDVDLGDPGVREDGQVGALLLAPQDGVDVGDGGAGPAAVVRVVADGEEADALLQGPGLLDVGVEVVQHGDVEGAAAGLHPVLAELVPVAGVHRLDRVLQAHQHPHEHGERPPLGPQRLPDPEVVLERLERDQRVVRRAPAQHLGARVSDVGVACWTL